MVTGGSGFLGQHIVKQLIEQDDFSVSEIRVFDVVPLQWHVGLEGINSYSFQASSSYLPLIPILNLIIIISLSCVCLLLLSFFWFCSFSCSLLVTRSKTKNN